MNGQTAADRLKRAATLANEALDEIRRTPDMAPSEMAAVLRRYAAIRLSLEDSEISDSIIKMVRISVARSMHISEAELKHMDKPGQCGSAPAVLSMRVLLFLAVQERLGVKLPPEKAADIETVQDLADVLIPLLRKA